MAGAAEAVGRVAQPTRRLPPATLAVALWTSLVAIAAIWGRLLVDGGTRLALGAPPLDGRWDLHVGPEVLVAASTAAVVVAAGPSASHRLRWRWLLLACTATALVWPVTLALAAGSGGITDPLTNHREYLTVVPLIHSPGTFLTTFVARIDDYSAHVRGHPPGMPLILFGLARAGLGGPGPEAALILVLAATTPAALLVAARSVAGEDLARRAAPFLVLAPAAVWIATSADALYMAAGAWAVALILLAISADGWRSDGAAAAGGFLFGVVCFLSFGLPLLAAIPLVVATSARRIRPLVLAAASTGLVVLAFALAGYWWLDGFVAARHQYLAGIAMTRPYGYFLLADLAAFALAAGPAAAIALARLRDRRLWLLVGGAATAVALADLSGMSKGEVERIWLPFLPWLMLGCAALPQRMRAQRALLAAQAVVGVAIQVGVATVW